MYSLASKSQVRQFLNIHEDDDRYDNIIKSLSASVTPLIEFYLDRKLEEQETTEHLPTRYVDSGSGIPLFFWAKRYPINDALPWSAAYSNLPSWESEIDVTDNVFMDAEQGGIKVFSGSEIYQENNIGIRLSYTGGYSIIAGNWAYLDVPIAIGTAAALQTAFLFDVYTKGSLGMASSSGDPLETQKILRSQFDNATSLIPEAVTLLRPYRRKGDLVGKQD